MFQNKGLQINLLPLQFRSNCKENVWQQNVVLFGSLVVCYLCRLVLLSFTDWYPLTPFDSLWLPKEKSRSLTCLFLPLKLAFRLLIKVVGKDSDENPKEGHVCRFQSWFFKRSKFPSSHVMLNDNQMLLLLHQNKSTAWHAFPSVFWSLIWSFFSSEKGTRKEQVLSQSSFPATLSLFFIRDKAFN